MKNKLFSFAGICLITLSGSLTVVSSPLIAAQPQSQTVTAGGDAVFSVAAPDLHSIPLGDIRPEGWLKDYATAIADGLVPTLITGDKLPERDAKRLAFVKEGWNLTREAGASGSKGWFNFEQNGYFIDGTLRLGAILDRKDLIDWAKSKIDPVVASQQPSGYMGPLSPGWEDLWKAGVSQIHWCQAQMNQAVLGLYQYTRDPSYLEALNRAYRPFDFPVSTGITVSGITNQRTSDRRYGNVSVMLATVEAGGDPILIDRAKAEILKFKSPPDGLGGHGVSVNELLRQWSEASPFLGSASQLTAVLQGIANIDQHFMLPYGLHNADEVLKGRGEYLGTETCDVVDHIRLLQSLTRITGDVRRWGDRTEEAMYNAGGAILARDGTRHCYYQVPNRAHLTSGRYAYQYSHNTDCCTMRPPQLLPYFVENMWLRQGADTLVAANYGPNRLKTTLNGQPVVITQQTDYPYRDAIHFTVESAAQFALALRLPAWCAQPSATLNDQPVDLTADADGLARIKRSWKAGDTLVLHLPMAIRIVPDVTAIKNTDQQLDAEIAAMSANSQDTWGAPYVSIHRGPLTYALALPAQGENKLAPGWEQVLGHAIATADPASIKVTEVPMPARWDFPEAAPVSLSVPMQRFDWPFYDPGAPPAADADWKTRSTYAEAKGRQPLPKDPIQADTTAVENITLIPYSNTHLRITMFPVTEPVWAAFADAKAKKR